MLNACPIESLLLSPKVVSKKTTIKREKERERKERSSKQINQNNRALSDSNDNKVVNLRHRI